MNARALQVSTIVGTILQVAMVTLGHWSLPLQQLFPVIGVTISLVAGVIYGRMARDGRGSSAKAGALAGGIGAFLGVVVSVLLGDAAPVVLAIGTISSAVTGAIGGAAAGGLPQAGRALG
ncbi:MAG: hypothetical protein JWO05_3588 [Gemmatimonadetes bacterium]|nr:hypothetical protein [Gemmatimonadota bacterium]